MKKVFYVYQLRIQGQSLPFYIGKGKGNRFKHHWNAWHLKKKSHKAHTIRQALAAGLDIYSEILADGLDEATAFTLEAEWINHYGRRIDKTGCLTNLSAGGEGPSGTVVSEETRARTSVALKGRRFSDQHKRRISESLKGTIHSEEARLNMSRAHLPAEEVFRSRIAWCNPLFTVVRYETGPGDRRVDVQCKHCGGVGNYLKPELLKGKVPRDHYECAVEVFELDRGSQVYPIVGGSVQHRYPQIRVSEPRDIAFTFTFTKGAEVVFRDLSGREIQRSSLPGPYIRARVRAERFLAEGD